MNSPTHVGSFRGTTPLWFETANLNVPQNFTGVHDDDRARIRGANSDSRHQPVRDAIAAASHKHLRQPFGKGG